MKSKRAVFMAILATGFGGLVSAADDLTVAASETRSLTASQANATVDVHGSLSVHGGTKDATVQLSVATALNVGRAEGDNASVTVGDYGQILMSKVPVTIGGPKGAGLVTLGGKRPNDYTDRDWQSYNGNYAHLFCGDITVPSDATAESGVLDIICLDENGALAQTQGGDRIQNLSPNCDARILFNGGSLTDCNAWNAGQRLRSTAGKALVLESVNGNPISLRYIYGNSPVAEWRDNPTAGIVKTAGDGDFVAYSQDKSSHYGWYLMNTSFTWGHKGDFRLSSYMCVRCGANNALPGLADGGDVVLDGNNSDNWLNLVGTVQTINGLTAGASSIVSNGAATAATLKFGSARADGVLNAPNVHGLVNVEKVGTGTLTITNTPTLAALTAAAGTVRFAPSDTPATLSSLTVAAGATVIVDGLTLRVGSLARRSADGLVLSNGGKIEIVADVAADERSFVDEGLASAIEKAGEGSAVLVAPGEKNDLKSVRVRRGTLVLAARGTTNEFWRVTIKETSVAGKELNLGPFRLYDADGNFCDGGSSPDGEYNYADRIKLVSNSTHPSKLAASNVMFSSSDYLAGYDWEGKKHGSDTQTPPNRAMFGAATIFSCRFNFAPVISDSSTWLVATYRIPALGGKVVAGYNVKSQWDEPMARFPGAWTVESSPSGQDGTWEVLDEQVGQVASDGAKWYRTAPYPVLADMPTAGLAADANVQVDAGATLDCSRVEGRQEISSLTVSWPFEGVGTLKGVRLAATGTLNVIVPNGVAGRSVYGVVPLAFLDSETGGDLSGWAVCVNGVRKNRRLVWCADGLAIARNGFAVILR